MTILNLSTPADWKSPVMLSMERPMRKFIMMIPMKIMKKVIRNSVAPWYMILSGLNFPAKSISPNIIAANHSHKHVIFGKIPGYLKLLVWRGEDFHVQFQEQEDESPMKMQQ